MKILLLTLFISFNIFANVEDAFKEFYYNDQINPRMCGVNTANFVRYLEQRKIFAKDMLMIQIKSPGNPWAFGRLIAVKSRWGKMINNSSVANYQHHTFLVFKGKVFDASFGNQPTVLYFKDYLVEMFIPKQPILLNGPNFKTRGIGPYYTDEYAYEYLKESEFNIFNVDKNGEHTIIFENLNMDQAIDYIL